ncbi:MAG: hypothetical protein ACLU1W_04955 [Collinsella sp.]
MSAWLRRLADLAPIEAAYIDVRTPADGATRLSYRIDLHLDPEARSADEVRRALDTLRAGNGIDYARGKRASAWFGSYARGL